MSVTIKNKSKNGPVSVRAINKKDLEAVSALERQWNTVKEGTLTPWTKSIKDIVDVIKQVYDPENISPNNRTLVCEIQVEYEDDSGLQGETAWICGVFSYNIQPDCYEINWFCLDKQITERVLDAIVKFMKAKLDLSETRSFFEIYIRDNEHANIRTVIPVLQKAKLQMRLESSYFENKDDAWVFSFTKKIKKSGGDKEGEFAEI